MMYRSQNKTFAFIDSQINPDAKVGVNYDTVRQAEHDIEMPEATADIKKKPEVK